MQTTLRRSALRAGTATALSYVGGMVVGVAAGNVVFETLPGHVGDPFRTTLAAFPAVAGLVLGSALWGVWMGRLANGHQARRMAAAGVLGLVPITLALGAGLIVLEPIAIRGANLPVHRVFTLLFVPTAFLIAGIGSLAFAVGLRDRLLVRTLWWRAGLAAAILFLAVNLIMEVLGWRVGAAGAAERYTMVTVMFSGALGAALAGGSVIGRAVARYRGR